MKEFTIRLEKIDDQREVENLTREAFWNVYCPGEARAARAAATAIIINNV